MRLHRVNLGNGVRRLATVAAGVLLLATVGCKRDMYAENEANPFYQKGITLRQDGRFEAAAKEFQSCVFYAPASHKAHLQLAVLYDDHLDDPTAALVHYRRCIELAGDDLGTKAQAEAALERAEFRVYESLAPRFSPAAEPAIPPAAMRPAVPADTVAMAEPSTQPSTPAPGLADPTLDETRAVPLTETPSVPPPADETPTDVSASETPAEVAATGPTTADRQDFLRSRFQAVHTVESGDTLGKMAKRYYGDSSKWRFIFDANRDQLAAPEKLKIGQKIRIPSLDSGR